MPNHANIASPINIHGLGRSGTTLLQNLLGATGNVQVCNEMGSLIFGCYRGAEVAIASTDRNPPALSSGLSVLAVHAALCGVMPSAKQRWCQKVGGIPRYLNWHMVDDEDRLYAPQPFPFPYRWYWNVLNKCFPASRNVLIIRDYRDVIVSRHQYSKWGPEDIAADIAVYFNLMAHPSAKVDCVIRYEDLVLDSNETMQCLSTGLELEFQPMASRALAWHASPSRGETLATARDRGFAWQDKYSEIITESICGIVMPSVRRIEQRFGIAAMSAVVP